MAKHRAWFRVVNGAGESAAMSRADADAYRLVHGGRVVACLPPTLATKEQQTTLDLGDAKPKGLH